MSIPIRASAVSRNWVCRFPHFTADFVGYLEIFGGLLLLSGLMTRLIAIPFHHRDDRSHPFDENLVVSRHIAIAFAAVAPGLGIWAVLHEVRSEYAQLLTTAFLLINGPGEWSLDALLQRIDTPSRAP